jgi:pseudaminic acid cytidylyltransferase
LSNIAIIPARGGSKRIPRKNIKLFCGKPIIAYSIAAAIQSGRFEEVMVSTDDDEIAAVARDLGAVVPFMRSKESSNDFATTFQVLDEVIEMYRSQQRVFENGCCIYPTAPFITSSRIEESLVLLNSHQFDAVFPVARFSYPVQRSLILKDGKLTMAHPEYVNTRSQDLQPHYHDSGQFFWFNVEAIQKKRTPFTDNTGAIILEEKEVQDIDHPSDWEMAEFKYQVLQANSNKIT